MANDKKKMMEFSRRLEEQQVTRDRRAADTSQINNRPSTDTQSQLNRKLEELYQSDLSVQKHSDLINKTNHQTVSYI